MKFVFVSIKHVKVRLGKYGISPIASVLQRLFFNPLRAAVEKSGQCGTSSSHGGRENSPEKHQPVSEGISWEPRIVSSHTAPQKIAKKISFQMTENDMMVA